MGERTPNHQEEKSVLFLLGGFREGQPSTGWRMRGDGREKEQREEKITTKQEKSVVKRLMTKHKEKRLIETKCIIGRNFTFGLSFI